VVLGHAVSAINEHLGLKPRTRARSATHSPRLASRRECPECGCRQVIRTISKNGQALGAYMCAACSTFFSVVEEQERA
jgi:transcription elongation factor Elf1